jgi:bifunctional non-homologous end joining protein LigD
VASRHHPRYITPELARLVDEVPDGKGWVHEVKYDGYRIECVVDGKRTRLLTRGDKDWSDRFDTVVHAAHGLGRHTALLDGEVVALDDTGRSSFQLLQRHLEEGARHPIRYFVFDILFLDGADLRDLPLTERRRKLRALIHSGHGAIRPTEEISGHGQSVLRQACRRHLEGVICKRADAPYRSGRGPAWLKVKCTERQEFVVVGYTPPRGGRPGIGALLLAVHHGQGWKYAGKVGTGMDDDELTMLHRELSRIERKTSPVSDVQAHVALDVHWVRPEMVIEVSFTEWTKDGRLRHPVYRGIREDKPARQVVHE